MPAQAENDPATAGAAEPETDAGPPRAGRGGAPERRCIATMERREQDGLIRFVMAPDGAVIPDLAASLPGRGAWVTANREALELAVKRGAFPRAFKAQAKVAPDLVKQTESLLAKRALDMLGLAKRSGDLILGFEQVREAVRASRPGCLIAASDASEDQRDKVLALVKGLYGPVRDANAEMPENRALPPVVDGFSGDELGMALGRERVIHACLANGRIAHVWMGELARLAGFRRVWLPGWQPSSGSGRSEAGPRN
jgi:predicted RNA-binding protein YlxR (DUF448 family)